MAGSAVRFLLQTPAKSTSDHPLYLRLFVFDSHPVICYSGAEESVDTIGPVDVVYTWVNGSDPAWRRRLVDAAAASTMTQVCGLVGWQSMRKMRHRVNEAMRQ
jgi:hypothetical protein